MPLPLINLAHVLLFAPFLIYVSYSNLYGDHKPGPMVYNLMILLGLGVLLYHGMRAYERFMDGGMPFINLFHVFVIAPLLIYLGYNMNYGVEYPDKQAWSLLLLLGVFAFFYHGYYAYMRMA